MFSEGDRVRVDALKPYMALVLESKRDMWAAEVHVLPESAGEPRWVSSTQLTMVRKDSA